MRKFSLLFLAMLATCTYASPFLNKSDVIADKSLKWWHGQASFTGKVIVPTCRVSMNNAWQIVDMGNVAPKDLYSENIIPQKAFNFKLINCDILEPGLIHYPARTIRILFDGIQGDNPDEFKLSGSARGLALQITDSEKKIIKPGKAMSPVVTSGYETVINYLLNITGNGDPLVAGEYYASLRYKVFYE